VPTTYNLIVIAFADADTTKPGGVVFNLDSTLSSKLGGYTDANFKADVQTLHSRGQKVIISVGGQNGNVDLSSATNVSNFVSSMSALISNYGLDGLDIDLENGIIVANLTSAIKQVNPKILAMAPQTLDIYSATTAYGTLITNLKSLITVVNVQFYNSGSMNSCDGIHSVSEGTVDFLTAQTCTLFSMGLRADQIGFGLPASPSGAGSGYVDPSIVNNALDCMATNTHCGTYTPPAKYPTIRGAMDWSINWDASNNYNFANTVHGHFSALP
jgi:chitinase